MKRPRLFGLILVVAAAFLLSFVVVALAVLPPGGTFVDDNGNYHEPMIEAIAAAGITNGCDTNPARYCPGDKVKRSEMATFLVRAADETGNVPSYQGYFADVPEGQWYTPYVERLYELGITSGCDTSPRRFCPEGTVLRSEMAALLVRFVEGDTNLPTYQGIFADVPEDHWYTPYVERLFELGITSGCDVSPSRYCPGGDVLRDQMASFLGRAMGLDPIVPPPPGSPESSQPAAPIRAAFMYPWFPKAWDQAGIDPFTWYSPSLGMYDSSDPELIDQQVELASGIGLEAFIASWWGPGHHTDSAIQAILNRIPQSPDPDFRLAVYYEEEGQSNPSSGEIANDLAYMQRLFDSPAYLRVDGKPVVFVWSSGDNGPDVAKRWADAKSEFGGGVYVVLKVFSGFRDVQNQPDSWHQYGPSAPYHEHLPYSAAVSPGFWLRTDASPALARDPARFQSDANKVASSGAFWQLVTTWNEWGEGTAVEPADEFGSTYLDILAEAFDAGSTPSTTLPPPGGSVTFTASGDIGASSTSAGTLQLVADVAPDAHFVVGDFSYNQVTPESAWCSFVKNIVGSSLPFQLLTGNHEDDNGPDGFVRKFTECLPDRLGVVGDYGVQYYADLGGLVRVIAIAADLEVDGTKYRYTPGSPERAWLESAVSNARADGKWVVVMHHKVCISSAEKACSVGEELADWEAANVDVVVMGHTHTYQRTHQLSCVDVDTVTQSCIADSDGTHNQGDGAVFVTNGLGGNDRPVNRDDDEYGYFAAMLGQDDAQEGHGIVRFIVSPTELTGTFIGSDTSYTDTFTIER